MTTIKSYTDIEQSKKLAEILPIESADMSWVSCDDGKKQYFQAENRKIVLNYEKKHWIPCWSLSALLEAMPNGCLIKNINGKYKVLSNSSCVINDVFNNSVDACVAMIEKLHELNLL